MNVPLRLTLIYHTFTSLEAERNLILANTEFNAPCELLIGFTNLLKRELYLGA